MSWLADYLFGGGGDAAPGCMAAWFDSAPTVTDVLQAEHRRLKGLMRRLDREIERSERDMAQRVRSMKEHAKQGRLEQARRLAIELNHGTVANRRRCKQKIAVSRVAEKVEQQVHAVAVDQTVVMLMRVLSVRMQVMRPDQFAARLMRYEELKDKEAMNEEQMNEFFSAADEGEEADGAASAEEEYYIVREIFAQNDIPVEAAGSAKAANRRQPASVATAAATGNAVVAAAAASGSGKHDPAASSGAGTGRVGGLDEAALLAQMPGGGGDDDDGVEHALAERLSALQRAPRVK